MKETEEAILPFFKHLGLQPTPVEDDPPDFSLGSEIGIETTSISLHLTRGLSKTISAASAPSNGFWVKVEVWEPEEYKLGVDYNNNAGNRQKRRYLNRDVREFLSDRVETGKVESYRKYGIDVNVEVLGPRKSDRHELGRGTKQTL